MKILKAAFLTLLCVVALLAALLVFVEKYDWNAKRDAIAAYSRDSFDIEIDPTKYVDIDVELPLVSLLTEGATVRMVDDRQPMLEAGRLRVDLHLLRWWDDGILPLKISGRDLTFRLGNQLMTAAKLDGNTAFASFTPFTLALDAVIPSLIWKDVPPEQREPENKEPAVSSTGDRVFSTDPLPRRLMPDSHIAFQVDVNHLVAPHAAKPLTAISVDGEIGRNAVTLRRIDGTVAKGRVTGGFAYDMGASPPTLKVDVDMRGVHLTEVVAAATDDTGAEDIKVGNVKTNEFLTGKLDGYVKTSSTGGSIAALASNLKGQTAFVVEDGELGSLIPEALGMDLTEIIGTLTAKEQTSELECAVAQLGIRDGVVHLDTVLIATGDSDIIVSGRLDLDKEVFDVAMSAKPKDFSVGSLRTPITIKGPLNSPKVTIAEEIAGGRIAAAAALGLLVGPLAAVIPLIEPGLTKDGRCQKLNAQIAAIKQKSGVKGH